jgi:hypothetical protein
MTRAIVIDRPGRYQVFIQPQKVPIVRWCMRKFLPGRRAESLFPGETATHYGPVLIRRIFEEYDSDCFDTFIKSEGVRPVTSNVNKGQ